MDIRRRHCGVKRSKINIKKQRSHKVQAALDEISNWTKAWDFKVSIAKTVAVCSIHKTAKSTTGKQHKVDLGYIGQQILIEKEFTFLGVVIDSPNIFKSHVDRTLSRCKNKLNLMKNAHWQKMGLFKAEHVDNLQNNNPASTTVWHYSNTK